MFNIVTPIQDLNSPELAPYRTLRRPLDHLEQRIFIAEGEKVVRRLLASTIGVRSILLTPEWLERLSGIPRLQNGGITLYVADHSLVETIVGYNLHQGIMAIGELPPDPTLDQVVQSIRGPGLIVALDGLVNSENVGVIVRNCAGFGVHLIIAGETSSSPYLRRSVRNSMGTIFTLPIVHVASLAATLRELRERYSYNVFAADADGAAAVYETDLRGNTCFVMGNEGVGLPEHIMEACNAAVSIPMMGGTDSLNVANATAVLLAEAMRQRNYSERR